MKVVVRNPQWNRKAIWHFEQPQFFHYEGEEVELKHAKPTELCLSTGNSEWPVRVIQRQLIESIDNQTVVAGPSATVTKIVKGSKGNEYVVTSANGKWHCTCPGFQFRQSCKHTAN